MRLLSDLKASLRLNEPLARHTSLKIGGPAAFYGKPTNVTELLYFLKFRQTEGLPLHILGGGCNTLFSDNGFPGLVLDMSGFERNHVMIDGTRVRVSAGTSIHHFAMALKEASLGGLEFLAHLPGTVGGALVMNAGFGKDVLGHRQEIGNRVVEVSVLTMDGNFKRLKGSEIEFGYRHSSLAGHLIIEGTFDLFLKDPRVIQAEMDKNVAYRKSVQDWGHPSAGSVFKNPAPCDFTAGEMVDRLGLKGIQVGGAQISPIHGNFFINKGGATAKDFMTLIDLVREKIAENYKVTVETEIKYVGV
jgi:UDP-N-acetylmuramate dehydrogenase